MNNRQYVIHYNTITKDKLPTTDGTINGDSLIKKGEIAVNSFADNEHLAIMNSNGKIVTFKTWDYVKPYVDNNTLKIKHFTLDGTEGELPISEWEDLINSDLYICNGTYIYSHTLNENVINFDIVTNMHNVNTLLTSITISFYTIENLGDKLSWSSRIYKGELVEDVVDTTGNSELLVMSQKAVTEQFNTTNNNIQELQNNLNTINSNYQKKIISVSSNETTKTIDSNTYYKWGTMSSLNITLNTNVDSSILNEYMFEFTSGSTPTTLSLPSSIKWLNGLSPIIEQNKTYQVSIINNLAIIAMFS